MVAREKAFKKFNEPEESRIAFQRGSNQKFNDFIMLLASGKMRSRALALSVITSVLFLLVSEAKGTEVMTFPEIKSLTTYIFVKSEGKFIPNGTGFFVGVKNLSKTTDFDLCLVAPKHSLYQPGTTQFLDTIYIRLNKKNGGVELAAIPIRAQGKDKTIFMHPDTTVDLAVIPALPDQKKYNFKFIPDQFILSKEASVNFNIYEGFEVFFPSLFFPSLGSAGNYPFIRFGRFVLITNEKLDWKGTPTNLYVIENSSSYGEDSGAPVFFYTESSCVPAGQQSLKLAGVIQGTFGDASPIAGNNKISIPFSNAGIAAVIPANKLYELLVSEELKQKRGF
jgi:hypothetical protein